MSKTLERESPGIRRAVRASAGTMPDGEEPADGYADPEPPGARYVRRGWPTFALQCIIEDREHHPDRCVIYPRNADESEVSTRWIAAAEGSYLDLEAVR